MTHRSRWLLCIVAALAARGDAFPPPATPLEGMERFLSPAPRLPWPPVSTLHEAWHVALPEVARTVGKDWRSGFWVGSARLKASYMRGPLPWLAIRGGVAVVYDGSVHAFDARTGGPPQSLDGRDPLILLTYDDGSAKTIDLVTGATLWTQPKEEPPAIYSTDFASTMGGPGTSPSLSWADRAPIRIRAVEHASMYAAGRFVYDAWWLPSVLKWVFFKLMPEGFSVPTFQVTATAYDQLTGRPRWVRDLGTHVAAWTWGVEGHGAMVDGQHLYLESFQDLPDTLEAYNLADGRPLWSSTPPVLGGSEGEPPTATQGRGTLDFLAWDGHDLWQRVNLKAHTVRTVEDRPTRPGRILEGDHSATLLGDVIYEAVRDRPEVNVLDAESGAWIRVLQTDQPRPGDAVHLAAGTLDNGQPVFITYAAGMLRGWLRGR